VVLRPPTKWKSCIQNHGNFVRITWIISRKFPTENPIFLNKIFHADLIQYSDSAHLFKVVGWFQIFLHSFCIEIFWSQGTEHAKIAPLHGRLQLNCWNWVWDYHIAYYAESQQQYNFRTSFKFVSVILEIRAKNMLKWQFRYHFPWRRKTLYMALNGTVNMKSVIRTTKRDNALCTPRSRTTRRWFGTNSYSGMLHYINIISIRFGSVEWHIIIFSTFQGGKE
jgi:hypothetical protein